MECWFAKDCEFFLNVGKENGRKSFCLECIFLSNANIYFHSWIRSMAVTFVNCSQKLDSQSEIRREWNEFIFIAKSTSPHRCETFVHCIDVLTVNVFWPPILLVSLYALGVFFLLIPLGFGFAGIFISFCFTFVRRTIELFAFSTISIYLMSVSDSYFNVCFAVSVFCVFFFVFLAFSFFDFFFLLLIHKFLRSILCIRPMKSVDNLEWGVEWEWIGSFIYVWCEYICFLFYFQGTKYDTRYPILILFTIFILGGICGLFLPETLHQKLPDSLEEAKLFGANQVSNSIFYFFIWHLMHIWIRRFII